MADATLAGAASRVPAISPPGEAPAHNEAGTRPMTAASKTAKRFDFELTGHRLDGLMHIAQWVERARLLTSVLEIAADNDPELQARLRAHGIAFRDCLWDDSESNGLNQVFMLAARDANAMTAAGMAMQGFCADMEACHG